MTLAQLDYTHLALSVFSEGAHDAPDWMAAAWDTEKRASVICLPFTRRRDAEAQILVWGLHPHTIPTRRKRSAYRTRLNKPALPVIPLVHVAPSLTAPPSVLSLVA